ncbi:hypothetical protein BHM03_00058092 [Ensete ventricosum]|nr:hypothetical protein BHM03_00058092 [Ensete ventricosum]
MEVVPLSRGFGGWLEHLPEDTHRGYLVACVLATLGPHSSTKNVVGLYAMVEESASLVLLTCARLSASDWEDKGNSRCHRRLLKSRSIGFVPNSLALCQLDRHCQVGGTVISADVAWRSRGVWEGRRDRGDLDPRCRCDLQELICLR